ncbi:MAG: pyridoxal kinase [Anaerococcus sp.]|uniref:pyridoxal kinase n=1 Tax=Anaerococcus sp. TaxID=1872515 RepID=UPI0029006E03|nr:pyridoxal kinase [Anaerococcus sp.]MDU1864886.1 pyridoxal kinase [Anaerococcus sp.]
MSNILVINDFVSKGKMAGNMMEPVLTYKGHQTFFLPTALISNDFSAGKVAILDASSYIMDCFKVWDELAFKFDLIFIGYIENNIQKNLIIDYLETRTNNPLVILDPIMGDDGSLYKGVGEEKIEIYKEILPYTDIIMPNFTEANLLSLDKHKNLIKDNKKYIITSVYDESGYYTLGVDKDLHKSYFEKLDLTYAGTGDLMDALFIIYYLENNSFNKSIDLAVDKMSEILKIQKKLIPDSNEIMIESYLSMLD